MAITTLDALASGALPPIDFIKAISPTLVAGRPHSPWPLAGRPGAGSFDTTLNGVVLNAPVNGSFPYTNPTSPALGYLTRFEGQALQAGRLLLCDRLWHNGGYTITTLAPQASTSPTWPARDANGSTNGVGVVLGLEVSVATGAGTPTITVGYTNSSGTAGRTATNSVATVASSAIGAFYPIGLQSGDVGVRSVQSLTLSSTWTSGTINLVAYRIIASVAISASGTPAVTDAVTGGQQRIWDSSVLWPLFIPSTTTATTLSGQFVTSQG
jgi:hypothetical protein